MTTDARRWEKDARAALREHYGNLGALIEPSESYQLVEAAGRTWAVHWPGEMAGRLPASLSLYSLHYRQRR